MIVSLDPKGRSLGSILGMEGRCAVHSAKGVHGLGCCAHKPTQKKRYSTSPQKTALHTLSLHHGSKDTGITCIVAGSGPLWSNVGSSFLLCEPSRCVHSTLVILMKSCTLFANPLPFTFDPPPSRLETYRAVTQVPKSLKRHSQSTLTLKSC